MACTVTNKFASKPSEPHTYIMAALGCDRSAGHLTGCLHSCGSWASQTYSWVLVAWRPTSQQTTEMIVKFSSHALASTDVSRLQSASGRIRTNSEESNGFGARRRGYHGYVTGIPTCLQSARRHRPNSGPRQDCRKVSRENLRFQLQPFAPPQKQLA